MAKKELCLFAAGEDERELLAASETMGFSAIPTIVAAGVAPARTPPSRLELGPEELLLHLLPSGVPLEDVTYMPVKGGGARVDPSSPAVELMRTYQRGKDLHHGRLYVHVAKGDPHERTASEAFGRLKRWLAAWEETTELECRVGPETAARWRAGEIRLMSATVELRLPSRG